MYQIVQEGALWPSVMITLGPAWRKVTIMPMLVALLNVGSQKVYISINVTGCMVQLKLLAQLRSYSLKQANLVQVKNLIKNPVPTIIITHEVTHIITITV